MVIGTLGTLDTTTIHFIEEFVGPKYGPRVGWTLMIIGGIMTAKRGYTNRPLAPPPQGQ